MHARAAALICAQSLEHNLHRLSERAGAPLLLPVKANAYGHGLLTVAGVAARHPAVWGLAVATPQEARALALARLGKPVVLLTPPFPDETPELAALGVRLPVGRAEDLATLPAGARVHLKVNTGMNRLGARPEDAHALALALAERGQLEGIYTHFASADEPDLGFAREQLERFETLRRGLAGAWAALGVPEPLFHCANSGAVLSFGALPGMALARPGLAAYGPAPAHLRSVLALRPVMRLRARVTGRHLVRAGESVSYGALWRAPRDTEVAVVGAGYADGYPRNATGGAEVVIGGERRPVLGRICMDQFMVDVSGLDVGVGDWADLWGEGPSVTEVAAWGQTVEYEVLTGVGERVERRLV